MNTKLATAQICVKNWATIIQERNESGLSVKDYCAQHQLSRDICEGVFGRKNKKLSLRDCIYACFKFRNTWEISRKWHKTHLKPLINPQKVNVKLISFRMKIDKRL